MIDNPLTHFDVEAILHSAKLDVSQFYSNVDWKAGVVIKAKRVLAQNYALKSRLFNAFRISAFVLRFA